MPAHMKFTGIQRDHIVFPGKFGIGANGETLLAFLSREAVEGKINAAFFVSFSETGHYGDMPVARALRDFANVAAGLIERFN